MKILILLTSLLSFASFANNSNEPIPIPIQVQSRLVQVDKASVKNTMAQRQMPAPTRHQTVLTKNADGTYTYQCKQKHNHNLDRVQK